MILRLTRSTDAAGLHRNCFPERSLHEVQDYLRWCLARQEEGRLVRLVAKVNGQVIANAQLTLHGDRGEIGSLVVAAGHRRTGIGTALIQALVEQAREQQVREVEISTRLDAPWIRAWYKRLGFVYQREHDYGDERVAILILDLTQGAHT